MYANPQYQLGNFYRKNKYSKQYNLPDSAWRNRFRQNNITQFPQGCNYFPPTSKKHFSNNFHDRSQIKESAILDQGIRMPKEHNNLDIHDIEGALPNTIMSLAVKNRMKSQQYCHKSRMRDQLQKKDYNHRVNLEDLQDELKKQKATKSNVKMFGQNYHIINKKLSTNREIQSKSKLALINDVMHYTHQREKSQNKTKPAIDKYVDHGNFYQNNIRYSNHNAQRSQISNKQMRQKYQPSQPLKKSFRARTEQATNFHPPYIPRQQIRKLNPTYVSYHNFINQSSEGKLYPNFY